MICGLVVGAIGFTNAQDGGRKITPEDRAKKSTERLATKLNLSADQKAKVLAIYTDEAKQQHADRVKMKEAQKQERQARRAKMVANDAKINALLTADQKKAYDAMKAERKAAMENRSDRKGPRPSRTR